MREACIAGALCSSLHYDVRARRLSGEHDGEDGMRAGGVEVHGGLCHLAIGAALEEEVVCHLFVGCKVGGEVPHQDTTIWSLLDLHLCASKGT